MRRFISYILLSSALLIGVGAAISPVIVNMNTDVSYSDGKTMTFRLSQKDTDKTREGYDPAYNLSEADGYDPVNEVADVMRGRLDKWGLSEYNIETVGYNTINVSVRPSINDDEIYNELASYLSFSGGDLEIDASFDTGDPKTDDPAYAHESGWTTMLDDKTASIKYITQSGVPSFPVVVIDFGTNSSDIEAFNSLITYCQKHTTEAKTDDSGNTTSEAVTCSLILWANRHEADYYKDASSDANVASRILINESCAADSEGNYNAAYFESTDDDKEYPKLQLIPSSGAITSEGSYDSSKANLAYQAAACLMNKINAEILNYDVDFLYSAPISATVESLVAFSSWHVSAAWSNTMIACLVGFALVAVILALFHRMLALGIVSVSASSVFLTLVAFVSFGTQFNIAALLGLLVIAVLATFGGLYYASRLKDELYKGRSLKKANTEAAKKSFWPTLDGSIVAIIIGIFVYIFGGDIAAKFGTIMVMGGFISAVMNLLLLRGAMWLLCNDNGMQSSFPKMIGVDKSKLPDLLKEEKQTYFGAYEKTDFTKSKKWVYGLMGAVVAAGIATMIAFGSINGTVYNDNSTVSDSTIIRLEARSSTSGSNDNYINDITDIYNEDGDSILGNIFIDGKSLGSHLSGDVTVSEDPQTVYDSSDEVSYYWYYYTAGLDTYYDLSDTATYNLTVTDKDDPTATQSFDNFSDALDYAIYDYYGANKGSGTVLYSINEVSPIVGSPYLGWLSLGVGVGIAVSALYLIIRYRPSRGLAASILALTAAYCSTAFFVFTRISTGPIVAIGSCGVAVIALLMYILTLGKEKEIIHESREKDKTVLAFRSESLMQANSRSASDIIILSLVAAYLAIDFFGLGPSAYSTVYLNLVMGIAFSLLMALVLLAPTSIGFAKLFSKIHFNHKPRKKKKNGQLSLNQKKSAEPEEAVFIGIND